MTSRWTAGGDEPCNGHSRMIQPPCPSYFTMTDYLRLGSGDIASDWADWGMAESDCFCLRLPTRFEGWTTTGREQRGILAAQIADLNLHVAVTLERLRLPSSLTKAVLTLALQEFLNQVRPTDANDWLTLVRAAQAVSRKKLKITSLVSPWMDRCM